MRTWIDSSICTGNKKCAEACPEVFEIVEGYGEVRPGMGDDLPLELQEKVRAAVNACPEGAVMVED